MYGTLGYIDNSRRPERRDSSFLGSNGHPARKDLLGARRADEIEGVMPPQQLAKPIAASLPQGPLLMERRCTFLEDQDKRRAAEIADLRARLVALTSERQEEAKQQEEDVTATVLKDTVEAASDPTASSSPATTTVPKGTCVRLRFPMKRVRRGEETQVWMRRRTVCPALGEVTCSTWLLLFSETPDQEDSVYVGQFA